MDRINSDFSEKKAYISPKIFEVVLTPQAHLMEGSYHHTLGYTDAKSDDYIV